MLDRLGLTFRGQHRTKPVRLWSSGEVRIVLNEQHARDQEPALAGVGLRSSTTRRRRRPAPLALGVRRRAAAHPGRRAAAGGLRRPTRPRGLSSTTAGPTASRAGSAEFEHGAADRADDVLAAWTTSTWCTPGPSTTRRCCSGPALLGLRGPAGDRGGQPAGARPEPGDAHAATARVRLPDERRSHGRADDYPEHVALRLRRHRRRGRRRPGHAGWPFLRIPDNYYDDLRARFGLPEDELALLREHDLLYDRDAGGSFRHFYTPRVGRLFFEVVERVDGYDGYGADNAPVRLAAQARLEREGAPGRAPCRGPGSAQPAHLTLLGLVVRRPARQRLGNTRLPPGTRLGPC